MIISLTWPESLFFEPESRPCLHLVDDGPFVPASARCARRAKWDARRNRVDRSAFSRHQYMSSCHHGDKMATIAMIPIGPVTTLNRSILKTERKMSGTGGDDFICGHCGYVMLEDFDPSTVSGNPVYQCRVCENNNDLPFAASDGRYWSSR